MELLHNATALVPERVRWPSKMILAVVNYSQRWPKPYGMGSARKQIARLISRNGRMSNHSSVAAANDH